MKRVYQDHGEQMDVMDLLGQRETKETQVYHRQQVHQVGFSSTNYVISNQKSSKFNVHFFIKDSLVLTVETERREIVVSRA